MNDHLVACPHCGEYQGNDWWKTEPRVRRVEFRSQGALWVDRLFPAFEEVK